MRQVGQCSVWAVKKEFRWHMGRGGMRWAELRWDEVRRDQMRWDEMRWEEIRWHDEVSIMKCKCEVWSVEFQVRPLEQRIAIAQSTHAQAWLAHGACEFYRWKKYGKNEKRSYSLSLRQLPPARCGHYWYLQPKWSYLDFWLGFQCASYCY